MKFINFLISIFIITNSFSQINTFYVDPILTKSNYTAVQDSHMVVRNTTSNNDKLFLYIGGTGTETQDYKRISEFAARQGYDVLNISYPNGVPAASLANSTDSLAFDNFRQEICYGTSLSNVVDVDSLNSINTRTINLVNYLDMTYPSQNWSQYLISSNALDWSKITVGGHSQGAGHAGYFAKKQTVEKVLMFSGPNDYSDQFSQPANWLRMPGNTPTNRYYSYLSLLDEIVDFNKQFDCIKDLGLFPLSDTVHVDVTSSPYENSNCLYTTQSPGLVFLNHSSPLKFSVINNSVWEYLLSTDNITSIIGSQKNHSISIYPNPTSSQLNIDINHNLIGKTYTIRTIKGQIIKSEKMSHSSMSIDLSELVSGSYLFSIENHSSLFIIE